MLVELVAIFHDENNIYLKVFYCVPSVMTRFSGWKENLKAFMLKYTEDMMNVTTVDAEIH